MPTLDNVGPEWLAEVGLRGRLEIGPLDDDHEPATARIELREPDERVAASLSGPTHSRAKGLGGGTIRVSLEGWVTQTY